ncbi:MAG TPA: FHA domain-containing protein [Planctomycetaceae bacterium]|nr:FHA domain-containing protein [Planctomycetaceae bacterium]
MQAQLRVIQKQANIQQVRLLPETVIGRATDCNLKIASTQVSRRHCRVVVNDIGVYVEDLCSANGTFLNGQRLLPNQPTLAPAGSQLAIGPAVFAVEYRTATVPRPELGAAPPPTPPAPVTLAAAEETVAIPFADVAAAIAEEPADEAVFSGLTTGVEEPLAETMPAAEPPKRMRSLFGMFRRGEKTEKKTAAPVPFLPAESPSADVAEADNEAPADLAPPAEEPVLADDAPISIAAAHESDVEAEADNPFRQFSQY